MIGVLTMEDVETNDTVESPSDITDELNSINLSLTENFAGIIAITLSTYSYLITKQALFCSVSDGTCCDDLPDTYQIKLAAYIIALAIAISSFSSDKEKLSEPTETCKEKMSNELGYVSSLLALLSAVIDVINILLTGQESEPPIF